MARDPWTPNRRTGRFWLSGGSPYWPPLFQPVAVEYVALVSGPGCGYPRTTGCWGWAGHDGSKSRASPSRTYGVGVGDELSEDGVGDPPFECHQELLAASAIDPEVAHERGYVSIDHKTRLERLGFSISQRRVPGLLIPIHGVGGGIALHQYRPDRPRTRADRAIKYEMPTGSGMVLDVPPRARPLLGDPTEALWLTEGPRKADAAVSADLCCIDLLGVWGFRGTNERGGKAALGDLGVRRAGRPRGGHCVPQRCDDETERAQGTRPTCSVPEGPRGSRWFVYLPERALLERKPGALDVARPLEGWDLPACFAILRRRLEADVGSVGTREFIKVLRLVGVRVVAGTHQSRHQALATGATDADAVSLILAHSQEQPGGLFSLNCHPHLKS